MTAFQNFWDNEIPQLLHQLNAPEGLRENIIDTLKNSARTGLYPNQIINALRIGISIKEGNQNIAFIASMQSGKSGTVYFLSNYILPAIGFIGKYENILFVTSMRDTDLYDQNCRVLHQEYYDVVEGVSKPSRIKVMKMSDFFNHPNPHKVVNEYNVQLIIRDEDQYGCGEGSSFQLAFFNKLRNELSEIKLLAVSATPYDILDAQYHGNAQVDVVVGVRPPKYYGITEMLEEGIIEDLPENFRPLIYQKLEGEEIAQVHPKILSYAEYLNGFDDGLGVIRESSISRAVELRSLLRKKYERNCDILVIGSKKQCDFGINDGLKEVRDLINKRGRRVILIVIQALTAGKDLGNLKEKVRFGI